MNCDNCINGLDQFLDGELDEASVHEIQAHCRLCVGCGAKLERKRKLRRALKAMPYQPPVEGFYDRVLEQTVKTTQRNEVMYWTSAGLGSAIAASVVAWLVLVLPVDYREDIDSAQLPGVTISLNVEKTVRVSFESVSELPGAVLTVRLPPGVEISGYDTKKEIKWSTDVIEGVNILSLPIVVRSGFGGTVFARIEHSGKSKTFQFDVNITWPDVNLRLKQGSVKS